MSSQEFIQRQSQSQKLSPQQFIYYKLLALPLLQYEQELNEILSDNPFLEDTKAEQVTNDESSDNAIEMTIRDNDDPYENDYDNDDEFQWQPQQENSLVDTLLAQLHLHDLSENELQICEEILGNLDDDGYLRCEITDIIKGLSDKHIVTTQPEILFLLKKIWFLEPSGVGARTLQECLAIQLEKQLDDFEDMNEEDMLTNCLHIIRNSFHEFSNKKYDELLKKHTLTKPELQRIIEHIHSLNPKPGSKNSRVSQTIVPDFIIKKNGRNEFTIISNDRYTPTLHLSKNYVDIYRKDKSKNNFLKEKYNNATFILNAIEQRKQTMTKIMMTILKKQQSFFLHGKSHLQSMIFNDVANEINVDISTISRCVNDKYVSCEYGVFELRYFFTKAIEQDDGSDVSNRVIKDTIKEMISNETKPLSDDTLAELLTEKGYRIARRTVSKYREELEIPVARLRKKLFP